MYAGVGIVGVGLLGASIGLALKKRNLCSRVVGIAPANFSRGVAGLKAAQHRGAIDEGVVGFDAKLHDLSIIVICTPVDEIPGIVAAAFPYLQLGAIVTDVGSTKGEIVRRIESQVPRCSRFVGSHPIAGSEKSGALAASADLFDGRVCVVTPAESSLLSDVRRVSEFWHALGMTVLYKSPEEHDQIVSRTSHLPHLAAALLATQVMEGDRPLAGAGFRDSTRIAAGSPDVWTAIVKQNRPALLATLADYQEALEGVRSAIEREDYIFLHQWLTNAKRERDALGS